MKKLNVDHDKCIGCGLCVSSYEENFTFDNESGLSTVISQDNITDDMKDLCPVGAIEIIEEECENCSCGNNCQCANKATEE